MLQTRLIPKPISAMYCREMANIKLACFKRSFSACWCSVQSARWEFLFIDLKDEQARALFNTGSRRSSNHICPEWNLPSLVVFEKKNSVIKPGHPSPISSISLPRFITVASIEGHPNAPLRTFPQSGGFLKRMKSLLFVFFFSFITLCTHCLLPSGQPSSERGGSLKTHYSIWRQTCYKEGKHRFVFRNICVPWITTSSTN